MRKVQPAFALLVLLAIQSLCGAPGVQTPAPVTPPGSGVTETPAEQSVGTINLVVSQVESGPPDNLQFLDGTQNFHSGDGVRVTAGGKGKLDLNDGTRMTLFNATEVSGVNVSTSPPRTDLYLQSQGFLGEVPPGGHATVKLPNGARITILGTTFFILYNPETEVGTAGNFDGTVRYTPPGGEEQGLPPGQMVNIPPEGEVVLMELPFKPEQFEGAVDNAGTPTAGLNALLKEYKLEPLPAEPTSIPTPLGGGSGRIAFVSDATGNLDIFLMDIANGDTSALTDSSLNDNSPSWSPSGSQIAFDSDPDGSVIFVKNIYETTEPRRVTDYSQNSNPAWSPDGQRIAFVSLQDGNAEIYVVNADGSGQSTNLTNNDAFDADPTWSPDSNQIAFASNRDGGGFQIYVMNADGTKQTRLPNNRRFDTWNSFPNWSHDGTHIVFQSRDNGDSPFQIYVMGVYGQADPVQLTFEGDNECAEWSPDDSLIAFTTSRDGINEVYMMNADGTGQINLMKPQANTWCPSWQPGAGQ
jgi:Tol biopolymer transport system component